MGQELTQLELDQFEQFLIVDQVDLIEENHERGNTNLVCQQDVFARLGHGSVGGGDNQDGAVHLSRAGDHVLDVIGVPRAIDVGVVPLFALVLDV